MTPLPLENTVVQCLGMQKDTPKILNAVEGKTYFICRCGKTAKFPLCDGTHRDNGSGATPLKYTAEETGAVDVGHLINDQD